MIEATVFNDGSTIPFSHNRGSYHGRCLFRMRVYSIDGHRVTDSVTSIRVETKPKKDEKKKSKRKRTEKEEDGTHGALTRFYSKDDTNMPT